MSVKQYQTLSRQTLRSALDGTPEYFFYPIKGKLEPKPGFKNSDTPEWRGIDTRQGNTGENKERIATAPTYLWESRLFPGEELATLFEFLFGWTSAPVALSAPDAAASRQMFRTASEMYGDGTHLGEQALALIPNTKSGSTTVSQSFLGFRPKDGEFVFKGGEPVDFKMNMMGGPWISAPDQAAITGCVFPVAKAFRSKQKIYIGPGATLTGAAPDYTNFVPNTMPWAKADDLNIKIDLALNDVYQSDGEDGPTKTEETGQIKITIEFSIDFKDPSSGWSSRDAWKANFDDIQFVPFMMTLDSNEIIPGCTNQLYHFGMYLPKMEYSDDGADRNNDGKKDKIKVKLESCVDPSVNVAAFAKLIY